jgi:hypothetical protein
MWADKTAFGLAYMQGKDIKIPPVDKEAAN